MVDQKARPTCSRTVGQRRRGSRFPVPLRYFLSAAAKSGRQDSRNPWAGWSSLQRHAVALLGVPVVATLCVWSLWWRRLLPRRHTDGAWFDKVVSKSDLGLISDKARTVAIWSLILFVALPLLGLGVLEAVSTAISTSRSTALQLSENCRRMVGVLAHFWPANGLRTFSRRPIATTEILTYVPVGSPYCGCFSVSEL